jgi:hypothetical protein
MTRGTVCSNVCKYDVMKERSSWRFEVGLSVFYPPILSRRRTGPCCTLESTSTASS